MPTIAKTLGRGIALLWDITARCFLGLLVLLPTAILLFEAEGLWWLLAAPFSFLAIAGLIAPKRMGQARRWTVEQLAKPYNRYFVRYFAEPIETAAEWAGKGLAHVILGAFSILLVIAGIAIAIVVGVLLVKGVAALPVSLAVIIGALIIAGALGARR